MTMVQRQRRWPWYALALAVLAVDQATKALWGETSAILIPGVMRFVPVRNTGVAFGLFQGGNALLISVTALACAVLLYVLSRKTVSTADRLGCALMLGGALGNLTDRVWHGHVVDFIAMDWLPFFPVFNLADTALVGGIVWLLIMALRAHWRAR